MSVGITVKSNIDKVAKKLERAEKNMKFALAQGLTWTAGDVKVGLYKSMLSAFDSPVKYTVPTKWKDPKQKKGALFLRPASKKDITPSAEVRVKDLKFGSATPAINYLWPNIKGGSRKQKRFEKALQARGYLQAGYYVAPAYGVTNKHGNLSSGTYTRILSALNANPDPMQNSPSTSPNAGRYFVKFARGTSIPVSIWERRGKSEKKIFNIVKKVSYKPRWNMEGIGYAIANKNFKTNLDKSLKQALKTAFKK